jgi:uncharacterized RDD family membrane protein YckC
MFCSTCGTQVPDGAHFCAMCGTTAGGAPVATKDRPASFVQLPPDIVLSSAWRRLGAFLLDVVLAVVTVGIGWVIWSLIIWSRGQSPGKQLLKMRVIRTGNLTSARWGRMAFRELSKFVIRFVAGLLFVLGFVVDLWLLWDGERQELWDKTAGTLVVDDPAGKLDPRRQAIGARPATHLAG